MFVIAKDGSGDFSSVQAAVDALPVSAPAPRTLFVRAGEYREKVVVNKDNVRIVGEDAARTALVFSDSARSVDAFGTPLGTFRSYTLLVSGRDVTLENLTIRNDAGDGRLMGQAVAAYAAGDRGVWRRCRLIGCQDTLFLGPITLDVAAAAAPRALPQGVAHAGDCSDVFGRQYFEDCYVQGDVDFIFGSYRAWFARCTLFMNARGGMYTAANTAEASPYGFVFDHCVLTGACAAAAAYLGRPWRAHARTVFLSCEMDACVSPQGFMDWDESRPVTGRLAEHDTRGARRDLSARHPREAILTDAQAAEYTLTRVLSGADGWRPDKEAAPC